MRSNVHSDDGPDALRTPGLFSSSCWQKVSFKNAQKLFLQKRNICEQDCKNCQFKITLSNFHLKLARTFRNGFRGLHQYFR